MPTHEASIKFSKEWVKLRPENRVFEAIFTTARGYTPQKETYYLNKIGSIFSILLNDKRIGLAVLTGIRCAWAHDMPLEFWQMDMMGPETTLDSVKDTLEGFYGNRDPFMIFIVLEWVEVTGE